MKALTLAATATAAALIALPSTALAQEEPSTTFPSPNAIAAAAAPDEWVSIAPEDLLVMTLAPDEAGNQREVIIQLMPAPFSQGWVANIRTLARAKWYDGITVNRVQDNYVVQWGDANHDNPESEGEAKPLPEGLKVMGEACYKTDFLDENCPTAADFSAEAAMEAAVEAVEMAMAEQNNEEVVPLDILGTRSDKFPMGWRERDPYTGWAEFYKGWPLAGQQGTEEFEFWPVHCYGMVGVGRGYSPDTGSGAELYTVIGHAPRHLDRNIALVGRIIEGMHHLSSMTRGTGPLGFYTEEEAHLRTPIQSIRVVSDLLASDEARKGAVYSYEYLSTESESFARYAEARANRRDPFFIHPAGGADICNIPVPIRPTPNG